MGDDPIKLDTSTAATELDQDDPHGILQSTR
jgi:hypothetical protein